MRSITAFVVLVLCANIGALLAIQNSYLVKRRLIESFPEALSLLRRFLPSNLSPNERCQRYAVLLSLMSKSHMDQFRIAEIGLAPDGKIMQNFKKFDIETVRQLLIDGITKFEAGPMDESAIELADCLSNKFRASDARARSFLNKDDLQKSISQYKSIAAQPLTFVLAPNVRHPSIKREELVAPIRRTLFDLFNGDVAAGESKFSSIQEAPIVQASATSGAPVHAAEPVPVPSAEPYSPPAPGFIPAQASAPSSGSQTLHSNQPGLYDEPEELSKEEHEYIDHVIDSLHKIYQTLPLEAQLYDRCSAYSKLINDDKRELDEIVRETAGSLGSSREQVFIPEQGTRHNFLFILSLFHEEQVGDETWVDIYDCVNQWVDQDPEVRAFIHDFEQSETFKSLTENIEGNS